MYFILKRILMILLAIGYALLLQSTAGAHDNTEHNFLVITDIHLNKTTSRHMDINPTRKDKLNDLDDATFLDLLNTIKSSLQQQTIPNPEFILLLGDMAQHDPETRSDTANDAQEVFQKVQAAFPSTPLFYIFGNNDSLDTHFGPFYTDTPVELWHSVYDVARSSGWVDGFLSTGNTCQATETTYPCLITEDSSLGHYSAYIQPSLRFIGINSIVFSNEREHLTEADAQKELSWIATQLLDAKNKNESVLLVTHIPLGLKIEDNTLEWTTNDHASFLQLINQYKENIIGMLVAHTHMDELKIIRTDPQHNVAAMINSPALCTYSGNAPAVKTYYYRQHNTAWELSDTRTFYISQSSSHNALQLQELYDYHSYYCTDPSQNITDCLSNVTLSKMNVYYTAGNSYYRPVLLYPDALYINLPTDNSDSSNNLGIIVAATAVAAIGVSVLAVKQIEKGKTDSPSQ